VASKFALCPKPLNQPKLWQISVNEKRTDAKLPQVTPKVEGGEGEGEEGGGEVNSDILQSEGPRPSLNSNERTGNAAKVKADSVCKVLSDVKRLLLVSLGKSLHYSTK